MKRETKETILMIVAGATVALYFVLLLIPNLEVPLASDGLTLAGWILLGCGVVLVVLSIVTLRWRGRESLIDAGIYGVVRHPMYLGGMFLYFAMICFVPHWAVAINSVVGMASVYWIMILGEQRNIEKFGDAYKHYMQTVPRVNLVAGIMRRPQ
jgi:protein-S-isoprenylcysteine O-methyltransferase Ste14